MIEFEPHMWYNIVGNKRKMNGVEMEFRRKACRACIWERYILTVQRSDTKKIVGSRQLAWYVNVDEEVFVYLFHSIAAQMWVGTYEREQNEKLTGILIELQRRRHKFIHFKEICSISNIVKKHEDDFFYWKNDVLLLTYIPWWTMK